LKSPFEGPKDKMRHQGQRVYQVEPQTMLVVLLVLVVEQVAPLIYQGKVEKVKNKKKTRYQTCKRFIYMYLYSSNQEAISKLIKFMLFIIFKKLILFKNKLSNYTKT